MAEKFLVITGNPVDGLFFYGPFDDRESAVDWAETEQSDMEYWVSDLHTPVEI